MDEITLTTILYKYKDQQPKQFGEDFGEKCYPVSAILNICEEYHQMMKEREQKEAEQQGNCNLPHVSNNEVAVCEHPKSCYYCQKLMTDENCKGCPNKPK